MNNRNLQIEIWILGSLWWDLIVKHMEVQNQTVGALLTQGIRE